MKSLITILFSLFILQVNAQHAIVQQLSNDIQVDSLVRIVEELTGIRPALLPNGSQTIIGRRSGTTGNTLTEEYIKFKLDGWGIAYDEVKFSSTGTNIIAKIQGRRTDKILMVGAHFDAVGTPNVFYPGADDNASGTAAVLELIRVTKDLQWPVTLHFAFWDEEEQGLIGSRASAPEYASNLIAYINHDMIAYDSNNDSSFDVHTRPIANSLLLANKIVECISLYQFPLKPRIINPGETATDHGAFWQNNLTAVAVNEEYAAQDDFNPHWHRPTDSITKFNISYFERMAKFSAIIFFHLALDTTPVLGLANKSLLQHELHIYPNPADQRISVNCDFNLNGNFNIINANGKVVKQIAVEGKSQWIDIADLSPGYYLIQLTDTHTGITVKRGFIIR
ncbi:MAG: M20/M25/M40 family metallo-hydrolase [Bacteroidia bacterium]|jgi:hypothetical protein|nr:M20/M25/M40 family metallo-hydrolase [Bacteroidia bacterium]